MFEDAPNKDTVCFHIIFVFKLEFKQKIVLVHLLFIFDTIQKFVVVNDDVVYEFVSKMYT